MSQAWLALEGARQRREQQQENAARHAAFFQRYTTSGTGETVSGLIRFSTAFTEEPYVTTGCLIKKLPDVTHYRYPTVTAGVIRWETEPIGPPPNRFVFVSGQAPPDPRPKLYVGAWMVFTVQCDPRNIPNTDGRNEAQLRARLASLKRQGASADEVYVAQAYLNEAVEAKWLKANPAKVVVEHHLSFSGVSVKASDLAKDELLDPGTFRPEVEAARYSGSQPPS